MNDVHVIKAALLGAGTVGSGVYDILQWQKEDSGPRYEEATRGHGQQSLYR